MRRILAGVAALSLVGAPARGDDLDGGMARIADAVAPRLMHERLRPGVDGPVDLFLVAPRDASSGQACDALSDTLLHRMAAALQGALRARSSGEVAHLILRQRATEGELAMQLEWVARRAGRLELRPSYGRMRADTIVGTFVAPVEIPTADLSRDERACFVDPVAEAAGARRNQP